MLTNRGNTLAGFLLCCILALVAGCGPGWEGYEDAYSDVGPVVTAPWEGPETVFVVAGDTSVELALEGLPTYDYNGALAVSLSELIVQSGAVISPQGYRYDFTATDGYNLLVKRSDDLALLPGWDEMKQGYLYLDSRYDDLTCGWREHPWGSALSAYQVKWMNGGQITALSEEGT